MAKDGKRAQNSPLGVKSMLNEGMSGMPNHLAFAIRSALSTPKAAATADPATILMNGATMRQRPWTRSTTITDTSNVTAAIVGPAAGGVPAGTSWTLSKAMGRTLTAMSMVTVPATTGVMILRSVGSHQARAI